LPALRAAEAEHQRAIRETPNYRPGYDPGPAVVDEAEIAELEARVEQARRRADEAEAELARLKAAVAEKEAKEERLRQSKRRARTKPKSSQRQAKPPRGADDPLGWPLVL
jgi:chromosome segregation ATPase